MDKCDLAKMGAAAVLLTVWGFFIYVGKTDVQPFVDVIKLLIAGLGVYHLTMTDPTSNSKDNPPK